MVAVNQLANLIGLQRQREAQDAATKRAGPAALGQAMQQIAGALMQKKQMDEEKARYEQERQDKQSETSYRRTMDSVSAQEDRKQREFGILAKLAQTGAPIPERARDTFGPLGYDTLSAVSMRAQEEAETARQDRLRQIEYDAARKLELESQTKERDKKTEILGQPKPVAEPTEEDRANIEYRRAMTDKLRKEMAEEKTPRQWSPTDDIKRAEWLYPDDPEQQRAHVLAQQKPPDDPVKRRAAIGKMMDADMKAASAASARMVDDYGSPMPVETWDVPTLAISAKGGNADAWAELKNRAEQGDKIARVQIRRIEESVALWEELYPAEDR